MDHHILSEDSRLNGEKEHTVVHLQREEKAGGEREREGGKGRGREKDKREREEEERDAREREEEERDERERERERERESLGHHKQSGGWPRLPPPCRVLILFLRLGQSRNA